MLNFTGADIFSDFLWDRPSGMSSSFSCTDKERNAEKLLETIRILHSVLPRKSEACRKKLTLDNMFDREFMGGVTLDHLCTKEYCDMINEEKAVERGYLPKTYSPIFPSLYVGRCGRAHVCWTGGDVLSPCRVRALPDVSRTASFENAISEDPTTVCAITGDPTKISQKSGDEARSEPELEPEGNSAIPSFRSVGGRFSDTVGRFLIDCRAVRPARRGSTCRDSEKAEGPAFSTNGSPAGRKRKRREPDGFPFPSHEREREQEKEEEPEGRSVRRRVSAVVDVRAAIVPFCNPNSAVDPFMESYGKLSNATGEASKRKHSESAASRKKRSIEAAFPLRKDPPDETAEPKERVPFVSGENVRLLAETRERERIEKKNVRFPERAASRGTSAVDVRSTEHLSTRFARTCEEGVGLSDLDGFLLAYFENPEVSEDLAALFRKASSHPCVGDKKNRATEAKAMVRNLFYGTERRDKIKEQTYSHHLECAKAIYRNHCAQLETFKRRPCEFRALDVLEHLPTVFSYYNSANFHHMELLKLSPSESFVDFFGEMCWLQWCVVCAGSKVREERARRATSEPSLRSAGKGKASSTGKKEKTQILDFSNCALALLYDLVHGFHFGDPSSTVVPKLDYAFKYAPPPGEISRYGYEKKNLTCGMAQRTLAYKTLQDEGLFRELYKVHFAEISRLKSDTKE